MTSQRLGAKDGCPLEPVPAMAADFSFEGYGDFRLVAPPSSDSYLDGGQLASSTGGDLVAFDERENFDASGAFSNPNAFTATAPGKVLFCGYTDDGATDTLAIASAITTVTPAVVKPGNTAKPRVKQAHNTLTCGRGSWSGSPTSFSYRWLVNGKAKAGARAPTLKVTRSLHGRSVRCAVQASNAAGSASALSAPLKVR